MLFLFCFAYPLESLLGSAMVASPKACYSLFLNAYPLRFLLHRAL